jgi:3-oxoacyl-[acyl-carrier-protein] synthase I
MKTAYILSDNIISSLGFSTVENLNAIESMKTGLKLVSDSGLFISPFFGSLISSELIRKNFETISDSNKFTKFEQLCIISVQEALKNVDISYTSDDTILILSTTKGNVDLLAEKSNFSDDRVYLWKAAEIIKNHFNLKNTPLVISNACISGVLGLIVGSRLIENEVYKNVIVVGADVLSEFVVSGFQSFKSLSTTPCKPFDKDRDGLSLGEAVGTVILTAETHQFKNGSIKILGGSSSNDANHISGPSRTGEGLYIAVKNAIAQAKISSEKIGFISTHGTATPYNDEMEAVAFNRLGLSDIPLVGLKGFFGHTLGAAGVIESIAAYQSMLRGVIHGTVGFENPGVSVPVIVNKNTVSAETSFCLKVASGFGGCNATIVFSKE